jgi:hypothetical protein
MKHKQKNPSASKYMGFRLQWWEYGPREYRNGVQVVYLWAYVDSYVKIQTSEKANKVGRFLYCAHCLSLNLKRQTW